ncbi:MAG: hypothetical protein U5L96_17965 [Owenweeksia sp.]|nr:hypothetical protein [Owenweeksia sp.]
MGKGLSSLGVESPEVMASFYFGTAALVMVVAMMIHLAARRALKMNPVEAIRTI